MEPALRPGDRLWLDPLAYRASSPHRGDVIVVADPADPARWLVKRVVGVSGDAIRVTLGGAERVPTRSVPGEPPPPGALEELEVPVGHVFVLSDRPQRSRDSRHFGPIPLARVAGRVWFRYAPRERRGAL